LSKSAFEKFFLEFNWLDWGNFGCKVHQRQTIMIFLKNLCCFCHQTNYMECVWNSTKLTLESPNMQTFSQRVKIIIVCLWWTLQPKFPQSSQLNHHTCSFREDFWNLIQLESIFGPSSHDETKILLRKISNKLVRKNICM
jgi:hypothetical protein